jgi:predicted nucleotidyltransferase
MNAELDEAVGVLAAPSEIPERTSPGTLIETAPEDHWRWRLRMAEKLASVLDPKRFAVKALYIFGGVKNATAGPGSDIDLLVHFVGDELQRKDLLLWLEGWSLSLSEINFLRTGYETEGLLDVHIITDEDIAQQTSYAAKIDAVTDAARPLPMGNQ